MPRIDTTVLEGDPLLRGVWERLGTPECHLTGGYLRDRLLGRKSVDLDLALPGDLDHVRGPAQMLAARLDTRAHVLGRGSKRVWRIEAPEIKVELWPLAELSLDNDIHRRDFSINALMWQLPNGPLDDRIGGLADLESRVLRAIKKKNLEEDPVRLVRAARFLAQLPEFDLEPRTARWIRSLAPRVRRAPPERLGQELLKLVAAAHRERGFQALLDLGILQRIVRPATRFDEAWIITNVGATSRMRPNAHPVRAALAAAGDAAALALLLRTWSSPHPDAVSHFAWPRPIRHHAAIAARMLDDALVAVEGSVGDRRAFMHRAGAAFPTVLAAAAAVNPDHNWSRWWRLWRTRGPQLVHPQPLLTGEEVGAVLGIYPSPALGRAIDALTEEQVRGVVRTAVCARRWMRRNVER
jgi:tRNA nucleotidyltransferase (CCA-adding enzyme)